ncbi:unnamed protein product [Caenorhabditis auriculariae]|uniref:Uncharacterized protein n=1 Tax=Caenorhabditis auriculariae TaxID=2777116 RepID=A0A8S1HKN3_9PELO|nr:unnamed protein product [Caenorhabditis auriculariae]
MARPVSVEAIAISGAHTRLVLALQEKRHSDSSNINDLASIFSSVVAMVDRISHALSDPAVRTSRDRNLNVPDVDDTVPVRDILRRLKNQVQCACRLADFAHAGPGANRQERAALDLVLSELDDLYAGISPLSSAAESE